MSTENNEALQKLKEMAQLTIFSGRLNEIQEKNLKNFPFIFFNGVKSVKIEYDLLQAKNSSISYHLTVDEAESNSRLEARFESLEYSIALLLWSGIKICVYFNDKKVFESVKNEQG